MKYLVSIVVLLAACIGGLMWFNHRAQPAAGGSLLVYCAAGVRTPVEAVAGTYQKEYGGVANLQYGGSAALLSSIRAAQTGDLFIAADNGTIDEARKLGLIREVIPIAAQRPVIAVLKGNPKSIHSLDDLLRPGVKFALCNPDSASIGKVARKALGSRWEEFQSHATVLKPTVTDLATDVTLGAVDAAIVWDSTLPQFPALSAVELPEMSKFEETVSVAVLSACRQPAAALRFARYLAAPEKGGEEISRRRFAARPRRCVEPAPQPCLLRRQRQSAGAGKDPARVCRPRGRRSDDRFQRLRNFVRFHARHGENAGREVPDAYYACDICFVPPVADLYPEAVIMTETDIVMAVPKGNPKKILALADFARPGLKIGICNSLQSSLGYLTRGILKHTGTYDAIMKNVCSQVPTADLLINQLRTGSLDAAIVYLVNVKPVKDYIDDVALNEAGAKAVQPFAVAAHSPNAQLAHRLLDFIRANPARLEEAGFRWRGEKPIPSSDIQVPTWMKQANE